MPGQPRPGDPPQLGGWGAEAPGREKRVFLPEGARVHCSRGPGGLTWAGWPDGGGEGLHL